MDNKAFSINTYPEGMKNVKENLLDFLPEDVNKEEFFRKYLILLAQR